METKQSNSNPSFCGTMKALSVISVIGSVILLCGCQTYEHPWRGAAYQTPQGIGNPISSTYAPMPQILPQVTVDSSAKSTSLEEEAETFDMDLSELLNQLKPTVMRR